MRRSLMPWLLCGRLTACHGKAPAPAIAGAPAALQIVDLHIGK